MKKIWLVIYSAFILFVSSTLPQDMKLIVTAEEANVYAEPDSNSYLIETIPKGTLLTPFQKEKIRKTWYYIAFDSQKRKSRVSGFVHESQVELAHKVQDKSRPLFEQEIVPSALEKDGNMWLLRASPTIEVTPFKEIFEPPVRIDPRKLRIDASPIKEERAFRMIVMVPVKLKEGNRLKVNPFPSLEVMAFKSKVVLEKRVKTSQSLALPRASFPDKERVTSQENVPTEIKVREIKPLAALPPKKTAYFKSRIIAPSPRKEELLKTPLSEDKKMRGAAGQMLFRASPTMEKTIFKEIVQLPVEAPARKLPDINPSCEMKEVVFIRVRSPVQNSEFLKTSLKSIQPIKKAETRERGPADRIRKEEQPVMKAPNPVPSGMKAVRKPFKWLTLGLGYGQSQGGAGGFIQFNTKAGISFHGGIGYYPTTYIYSGCDWVKDVTLFSGGIKYYLPLNADPLHLYFDLQFGGIGVEAAQIIKGIWHYTFVFDYKQKTLWGLAFLGGLELRWGRVGLNGALGLSYNITKLDWDIEDYFLTFDLGLLFYF